MDWHKLQQTLFEMDPTDPREDLAKLQAVAKSGVADVAPTKDYVAESAEVPEGSLSLDKDYSVSDFAALAGVNVNEGVKDSFKAGFDSGMANYNTLGALYKPTLSGTNDTSIKKNKEIKTKSVSKSNNSTTAISDLSKGDSFKDDRGMVWYYNPNEGNWRSKDRLRTISPEQGFEMWMKSHSPRRRSRNEDQIEALEARIEQLENIIENLLEDKKQPVIKARDPSAQYMNDLRKSGAMGAHKDKKKEMKAGKMKHKGQSQYESIKDMLYAKLAEKK